MLLLLLMFVIKAVKEKVENGKDRSSNSESRNRKSKTKGK